VSGAFDYEFKGTTEQRIHELKPSALTSSWVLGAIVGPSGSGKSQNMKRLAGDACAEFGKGFWADDLSVLTQVHPAPTEALKLCRATALSDSAVLRPFHVLSNGEKARAQMARCLGAATDGACLCLDEFTSNLDRSTAAQVCKGVATYLRTAPHTLQVVVATVHEDILPWLLPDWVLQSGTGVVSEFSGPRPTCGDIEMVSKERARLRRSLSSTDGQQAEDVAEVLRPPVLKFSLKPLAGCSCSRDTFEEMFEEHHYLKGKLPTTLFGLLLRDEHDRPIAFDGVAHMLGKGFGNHSFRDSRLVVLPEAQGFGIGPKLSNCVGCKLRESGCRFIAKTAHPRLGAYREAHPEFWRPTTTNKKASKQTMGGSIKKRRDRERLRMEAVSAGVAAATVVPALAPPSPENRTRARTCFSHEFIGGPAKKPKCGEVESAAFEE